MHASIDKLFNSLYKTKSVYYPKLFLKSKMLLLQCFNEYLEILEIPEKITITPKGGNIQQ